jgi:DNA oxidative demethylase
MFPELLDRPEGFLHFKQMLGRREQERLVSEVRRVVAASPFFRPVFPRFGGEFRLQLTNCGHRGWVSDLQGMRYQHTHPVTAKPWPPMPDIFREIAVEAARQVGWENFHAESCLINFYEDSTQRLRLHRDETEDDKEAPIISVSLGDIGLFGLGGMDKKVKVETHVAESGDVMVMGGAARLRYHSVEGIVPGTSDLLRKGGRLNLTIRTVTRGARAEG